MPTDTGVGSSTKKVSQPNWAPYGSRSMTHTTYKEPSPKSPRKYRMELKAVPSVDYVPEIIPMKLAGRLTGTTFLLRQPLCYFSNQQGLNCSLSTCEIWLAVAREAGVNNFDTDKVQPSFDIVSASPYPEAFQNKNYYVTRLGVQNNFLCAELPGIRYFRVGAEGNCSTPTCNGILPAGSTARVKYLLIDPENRRVSYETKWSFPITLISLMPSSSIDDWTWKRSGGMVVITVITSCLLAILLLLVAALLLGGSSVFSKKQDITTDLVPGSFSVRRYSTQHNVYSQASGISPHLI
ncbi:uroplakin-3b-like isoform X3 [Lepisosteus oculatus]|uniref:uroplakin-3b-like isoform X3 n=1 Tax=Lepisosteus oculatus TaxID=7918 RepID=UPI00073FEE81|nr:PREDICTED: uroplakin-3b-like isoform X4 [Lepisosteus oculatus]